MDPYLLAQHAALDESHWWFAARRMIIRDTVARWLDPGHASRRILDVGCGPGGMVGMLQEFGAVTALDSSADAIDAVRHRYPSAEVAVGDIPDGVEELGTFDLVTAFDVIEHISDDVSALTTVRGSLRPGGQLVCTAPAYESLWGPHDELNHHQRRYTKPRLEAALVTAGFNVEWSTYFNTLLFPAIALARLGSRLVRPHAEPSSDFDRRVGRGDAVLFRIFAFERHLLRRVKLPFGVSVLAVATKPR